MYAEVHVHGLNPQQPTMQLTPNNVPVPSVFFSDRDDDNNEQGDDSEEHGGTVDLDIKVILVEPAIQVHSTEALLLLLLSRHSHFPTTGTSCC